MKATVKNIKRYQCTTTSGKRFIVADVTYGLAWESAQRRYPNQITAMNELPPEHGQQFNGLGSSLEGVVLPPAPSR